MDKKEAKIIANRVIERYRRRSYDELVNMIDNSEWIDERAESGTEYQIQVQVFWDDEDNGIIRCFAAIDNGGILSFMFPQISEDFLMNSNNEFIGE